MTACLRPSGQPVTAPTWLKTIEFPRKVLVAQELLLLRLCLPVVGTEALVCACKTQPKLKKLRCVGYKLFFSNSVLP